MRDLGNDARLAAQAEILVGAGYLIRDGNPRDQVQAFRMTWKAWTVLIADAEQPVIKPRRVSREQIERELATHRNGTIACLKF